MPQQPSSTRLAVVDEFTSPVSVTCTWSIENPELYLVNQGEEGAPGPDTGMRSTSGNTLFPTVTFPEPPVTTVPQTPFDPDPFHGPAESQGACPWFKAVPNGKVQVVGAFPRMVTR